MLRLLAPFNLRWVEEPVIADDLARLRRVARAELVPISGGEHEYTLHGFRQALDLKAFDIAQFDVNRVGGITAAKKIADLCEANDVRSSRMPARCTTTTYHVELRRADLGVFPKVPVEVGNELFWYIFDGEPVAEEGFRRPRQRQRPDFGLTLKTPDPREFRLTC